MLNEEAKARIIEFAREIKAFMEEHDLLFWEGGVVRVAPVGAAPTFCTVEIQGIWDENVLWRGVPGGLNAGDEVLVWENPVTHRREIIGGSGATASGLPVHDHSDDTEGGNELDPAVFTPQTFIVGPNPALYDTLGAAVAAINVLGPTAATPYTIRVQGIITAEAGNVTIPRYVHVEGVGEGSTVNMGANSLLMSDDSSLLDLKVLSSNASYAVAVVGKDNVILRDVHCIQSGGAGTPDCFHVSAASTNVHLYDCVAEIPANGVGFHVLGSSNATLHTCKTLASACDASTYGFQIGDTAEATLDYCKADDDTYFNDALHLDDTNLTCVTRWCTFRGHDNDVNVAGTNPDWQHLDCHFDPDNSTVAAGTHTALPTKRYNQTVIVAEEGGDFQALSEAIAWVNAQGDAAANKLYGIEMKHGNFAETAGVTIPQHCHVYGEGRGTRIEMGNSTLSLSPDSSLMDVTVITVMDATTKYCIESNNVANWYMRDVRVEFTPHATGTNIGFYFHGLSFGICLHCRAEPQGAGGNVIGFCAEDDSQIQLWHCQAWNTLNFADAVYIGDDAEIISEYCSFCAPAAGDDVHVCVDATWSHFKCHYDATNVTILGTEVPYSDGAVEIASDAVRSHSSLFPDLGTTTLAQKWGNVYLGTGQDAYPRDDEAGIDERRTLWYSVDDDFCGAAFGGAWGWAGAPFATPGVVNFGSNSLVMLAFNAGATPKGFLNRNDELTAARTGIRVATNAFADSSYVGIRHDDGTDNNYVESCIRKTAAVNTLELISRYRIGGGAVTTTVHQTIYDFPKWMFVSTGIWGTLWANWGFSAEYGVDSPALNGYSPVGALGWTPTRKGIVFYSSQNPPDAWRGPWIDFYHSA